jgi:hypothetical protein
MRDPAGPSSGAGPVERGRARAGPAGAGPLELSNVTTMSAKPLS